MEGLHVPPSEEEGETLEEEREENGAREEGGGMKASSSPAGSTTDEETDEDSEPEPPQVIRRKVSFADAFGLNLVSVKEFDNPEVAESSVSQPPGNEAILPLEEFYMSCLFTVPSSLEELDHRLQKQMVELENIELLPGTTTLRGIVRVVNLCYSKSVYARVTLDRWTNYFDLSAEYLPGSSDWKTDRFTFKYTLVPPFERGGTRVEICLRYETSAGTFWANNKDMNYVLFCHQRGHVKELWPQVQEESIGYKSKRSCLKANRRGSAEEKTRETSNPPTAAADAEAAVADRKNSTDVQPLLYQEEHKPLVESIKSRHRAARMARVQDYLSQRRKEVPKAYSHDSANGQKVSQPLSTLWGDSAGFLHKRQKKQTVRESPQVLTYHQIPLLTLDWNTDKAHQWGAADKDDIWTEKAEMTLSKASQENIEDAPSVDDVWRAFSSSTDDTADKKPSVCDVWQAFLNGPSTDHSGVPESEWLQTAALVSPSNDKEPDAQHVASIQEQEFQVGPDAPTTTSALCQLLSDTCQISAANAAVNTEDQQPTEACVGSPRDDSAATRDASRRSQNNAVTGTLREFRLKGATPVSEGDADSSTECHKRAIGEEGREGEAEGMERDEPSAPHTADFVTSSGESETTDMTAMPESQNATAVDRISQGSRPDEGLSSSRGGEVIGTAHNVMDDTLAFRGTIRTGTKDGVRFVFPASRQGTEEGTRSNCTENKGATDGKIFRPQETEECKISQRYADEKQHEKFRLNQNSGNPLQEDEKEKNELRLAQTNAHESNSSQTSSRQSQVMASEVKLEESEREDVASNNKDSEVSKEVEPCFCTAINETKTLIGAEEVIIQLLNEEHYDKALQCNSSWKRGNTAIISDNKQSRSIKGGGEERVEKSEDSTLTQIQENALEFETDEQVFVSNQTEEGKGLSCDGIIEKQQGVNPAPQARQTVESREMKKIYQGDHDTFRPFRTDKCTRNPLEVVKMRWTHSLDSVEGQKEDVGREISPEEVEAKKNVAEKDTSTELQHQPETLERTEGDMSQRDKDERVSIGKLKIEVVGESMGNTENAQGETGNSPDELKEQELSAEVESSPRVEYNKLSEGTKDPITARNAVALEVIESGLEEMFIERFGDNLVRGIWEEVFGRKEQASNRDRDIVDGIGGKRADTPDNTQDCHHLLEEDFNEAFDSGVFSPTDLATDPNASLCQGREQISATTNVDYFPKETSQSLAPAEQTHFPSVSQTDLNSRAHLSRDFTPIVAVQSRPSLTESAQSSPKDQENYARIKERSVTRQDAGRPTEDGVVTHRERLNPSAHTSHTDQSSSSEKSKESDGVVWRSVLYILSQITRLLICILLVAGFFFIVFLYDFPAFFALYIFSLCWWFYKWKRHRVMTNKAMVG